MRKEFVTQDRNAIDNQPDSFDNIDLLNLSCSSRRSSKASLSNKRAENSNETGDDYYRHPRVVKKSSATEHDNPAGDTTEPPVSNPNRTASIRNLSGNECQNSHPSRGNKSLICLYNNSQKGKSSKESLLRGDSKSITDEFLLPPYERRRHSSEKLARNKKPPREVVNNGTTITSASFPFKQTSSGNLKIQTQQVAFQTEKFSVLVADPDTTQVTISDKRTITTTAMQKDPGDFKHSINTFMNMNSLLYRQLCDAPVRKEKEASEYEGKATSEILDPELNLNRLGYTATDAIDWNEIALPEKKNLYLELYARITNFTNADCKVYIDNEEFNCHLLVLQCYSEVFHTYVAVKKVELPSDKCSPASFAFIYEWMITGDPSYRELNRENVLDIFNAAKYLKIKDLVEQCWAFIDNPSIFSEDTAFLLYIDAKEKNLPEVRELMLPRIEKFFLMLVSSQDWLELDLEDVQNFLQSNYICVNCEMEVFMSAVRWLKHDWVNRDTYKAAVLSCVRFGNIAPWQLVDIKRNPDNPEFCDLVKDHEICKMIDDGLAFVIIKYWYGPENEDYQHWNTILALKEPPNRNWSGTEKTYFTYREFLIYLDQYRRNQMIEKSKPQHGGCCVSSGIPGVATCCGAAASKQQHQQHQHHQPRVSIAGKSPQPQRLSPRASLERVANTKIPTTEEFLMNRRPVHSKLRSRKIFHKHRTPTMATTREMRTEAAVIIQRAFRRHRLRRLIIGLAARVHKMGKKRENSALVRKFFELSKRPNSSLNSSDVGRKRQPQNRCIWTKYEPEAMRVQCGGKKVMDKSRCFKNDSSGSDRFSEPPTSPHRKRDRPNTSLFYMEHESVLVFGGINVHYNYGNGMNTGKDIYRYLPLHNKWEYVGEMPAPRTHHCLAYLNGRVYVVGGTDPREQDAKGNNLVVDTVWSFDPVKRIWFTEGSLNTKRKNFGLVVVGCFMYAIGGQDRSSRVTNSVERYNPSTSEWCYVASMKLPRMGIAYTKFEEKIWIGGGVCGPSQHPLTDCVECYDPETNQWTEGPRLRMPRCFASFFAMSNNLYLIAGAGDHNEKSRDKQNAMSLQSIDVWNKKTRRWDVLTEMEVARHGHTTAFLGTQILIIGGVTTIYMRSLSSIECYCTTRGTWIRGICTLPMCLSGHATVTLPPATLK